jgi:hypothetical protein
MRPPFPSVIDSTLRSAFTACPRKFFLEYVEHWKPRDQSVHLHAGGAYAHGLEHARLAFYRDGRSPEDAVAIGLEALMQFYGDFACPSDSAKSLPRMLGALEYYFNQYPLESDAATPVHITPTTIGVEFSFAEPLHETRHPESGDPLLYCGRMDMVVDFAGARYGLDDKTTSSLGASWSKQWELRAQFTGYCWGAAQAGIPLAGFLVRGVSILKTRYDTQQALTYRPAWMIERWYEQLLRDTARMKECWETEHWDYALDEACMAYGGCPFRGVCLSREPDVWLRAGFQRRRWNPVTRAEELVGEGAPTGGEA